MEIPQFYGIRLYSFLSMMFPCGFSLPGQITAGYSRGVPHLTPEMLLARGAGPIRESRCPKKKICFLSLGRHLQETIFTHGTNGMKHRLSPCCMGTYGEFLDAK